VDHNKLRKILQEMRIHFTCLLRNLYVGQEGTVRTRHETTDWFQIEKELHQGCLLSLCLFNFYAENIMGNARLDEAQAEIKIAQRSISQFTQTHVHRVSDAIQPSHPLSSPSPPAPNPSQHQSLFQWVNSSHEVATVLEFQLQHHSFQRNPRADLLQNGPVGSPYSPRDSQEFSPTPQFKSINSSVLSFLYSEDMEITSPITSWQIDGETMETVTDLIFLGSKITADGDCSHEIKTLTPWKKSCDQPRQHIKKQRHYIANKDLSSQSYDFSSSHVWMWELGHKESWAPKNRCFWTVMLEKTLESPLYCKEIKLVHPKGNQSWIFIGRTDVEAETPIL